MPEWTPNIDGTGRGNPPTSDAHFQAFAQEHLLYEVWMLVESLALLQVAKSIPSPTIRQTLINAGLELTALHSRGLHEFFDDAGFPTDAKAKDFREGEVPARRPREGRGEFAEATGFPLDRADKEIVHLTYNRFYGTGRDKEWVLTYIRELRATMRRFLQEVPSSRIHPDTKKAINNLLDLIGDDPPPVGSAPSAPRPPVAPQPPTSLVSDSNMGTAGPLTSGMWGLPELHGVR